jgi:hypothetical protein
VEGRGVEPLADGQAVRTMLRRGNRAGVGALCIRQHDGDKLVKPAVAREYVAERYFADTIALAPARSLLERSAPDCHSPQPIEDTCL